MALHHLALAQDIDAGTAPRKSLVWTLAARADVDDLLLYQPEILASKANMTPRSLRTHLIELHRRNLVVWRPGDTVILLTYDRR